MLRHPTFRFSGPKDELAWLNTNPPLHDLMERYPEEWDQVGTKLVSSLEGGLVQQLNSFVAEAKTLERTWKDRIRKSQNNHKTLQSALPFLVRSRMGLLAADKCLLSAATGITTGDIRFNLFNGFLMQTLLFRRHLTRKPVSLGWFRFWWRFMTQKRILMPLVQKQGIYCFYSRILIKELSAMIGNRSCLEIAAGDGTLSRFLAEEGVNITATDNYSWTHAIEYPDDVKNIGAKQALQQYEPQVVVCSWPPPGNSFERQIFSTKNVELYIVIGSRYQFASGNWKDYANQRTFDYVIDQKLSGFVIPPELESAVLVFRKRSIRQIPK